MSEVPFLDASLGPDLATLSEEELLRCFLNEDYEAPFDSKVPSDSSPLNSPSLSCIPTPTAVEKPIQPTHPAVVVKKEVQAHHPKSANGKAKSSSSLPTPPPPLPSPLPSLSSIPSVPVRQSPSALLPTVKPQAKAATAPLTPTKPSALPTPVSSSKPPASLPISAAPSPSASPLSLPSPSPSPPLEGEDKTAKRQRRLLKNRESAQLSRVRKKMYIEELERKVNELTTQNNGLRDEVVKLNDALKHSDGDEVTRHNRNGNSSKRYAGVCLLVVLFSIGLFLNVSPNGSGRQQIGENRLIEFENNSSSFHDFGNSLATRHGADERSSPAPASSSEKGEEKAEKGEKRSYDDLLEADEISMKCKWEDCEEDPANIAPIPKRTKLEISQESLDVMDTGLKEEPKFEELEDDENDLFDVLADDAFSDDGTLTTSTSSLSPPASPSPFSTPSTSVPASPSIPTFSPSIAPSSPAPSPAPSFGIAIVVPSFPIGENSAFQIEENATFHIGESFSHASDALALLRGCNTVNVHVWPVVRTMM